MQFHTVLFDFDYTLADTSVGIVNSFHYAFDRLNIERKEEASIKKTIGMPLKAAFTALTGLQDPRLQEQFRRYFVTSSNAIMTKNTVLFDDTIAVLRKLKQAGCQIAIVSNKYRFRINESIEKFQLHSYIDTVIGGEDVSIAKPSPEGCLKAMEQLQAQPENTVYIGDSVIDAKTAQSAGIALIAVTTGTDTAEDLKAYPHLKICNCLAEITDIICK